MFKSIMNVNEFGGTERIKINDVVLIPNKYGSLCTFNVCYTSIGLSKEEDIYEDGFDTYFKKYTLYGDPRELIDREFEVDYDVVREDMSDTEVVINYIDEVDGNAYKDVLIYKLRVINVNGDKYDIAGTVIELINGVYRITDTPIELQLSLPEDTVPDDFDRYVVVTRIVVNPDGEVIDHSDIQLCHFSDINREYICELFDLTVENGSYSMGVQLYSEDKDGYLVEIDEYTHIIPEQVYRSLTSHLSDPNNIDGYYIVDGLIIFGNNDDVYARFDSIIDIPVDD